MSDVDISQAASAYAQEPLQEILARAALQQAAAPQSAPLRPGEYLACGALHGDMNTEQVIVPESNLHVGIAGAQGRRHAMEDATAVHGMASGAVVALFDGHGGGEIAQAATRVVPETVEMYLSALSPEDRANPTAVRLALKEAFSSKNPYVPHIPTVEERLLDIETSGSTAVVAVFLPEGMYVANLGDSRAVLVQHDGSAVRLSVDHKPDDEPERTKIERRGGRVTQFYGDVPRVEATLATSRSLGDWELPLVRRPQVTFVPANSGALAVVLGCDGIFDVLSDATVAELVQRELPLHTDVPGTVARYLVNAAFNRGSRDNMSAIVVELNRARG